MKFCTSCRDSLHIAFLLLSCSAVTVLCQKTVIGFEGQAITLPCSYKVRRSSDLTSMCWGRGDCPNSKCSQELIWTDGQKVTFRSSSRYQLYDRIKQGIVSLTIAQATPQDAGTYCCRIEHAGWFNDEKNNIRLTVEKAPTTTVKTTTPKPTTLKTTQTPTTLKTTQALTTLKTTQAPTTLKATTPTPGQTTQDPSYVWTTAVEVTTHPPPSVANDTSPPPPPLPSTTVFPAGTTESKDLMPSSSGFPSVTSENKSREVKPASDHTTDLPGFISDHKVTSSPETEDTEKDQNHAIPSLWPQSLSPDNNGISDLFQGNITVPNKKNTSTIIIAVSLSILALVVICVILLQLKGQKRGRYPLGLDPHLELVTHAEESMTEIQAEAKDPNGVKEDKAVTNHVGNMCED